MFMLYFDSNQGMQAGVENGAMLTTYLFRYTSECTISWQSFQNFLSLKRQGTSLTKILRTFLLPALPVEE